MSEAIRTEETSAFDRFFGEPLSASDPALFAAIDGELHRQRRSGGCQG